MSRLHWFALRVRPRFEKLVALLLENKGYEQFLPLYRCKRRRSDRFKEIDLPLFPGYLFCRFDPVIRLPILMTQGVLYVVGQGKIPVPVHDAEITAIHQILKSGLHVEPWPFLEIGQRVRITKQGPLCGLEGILLAIKNRERLIVSIRLLHRSVSVEIDRDWATAVDPSASDRARLSYIRSRPDI